jgi:dihydrofolate reductase
MAVQTIRDSMRRIVMFNHVSADGYFADAKGTLDWVVQDTELDKAVMRDGDYPLDTILFGRRTYEMFEAFWPTVTKDSLGPHGAPVSPAILKMADILNETPKIVFSKTMKEASWKNTRVVPNLDIGEVKRMKERAVGDSIIFGSGSIVSQLTEHGLIDEYQIVVCPVMLGSGKPLVDGFSKIVGLKLENVREFPTGKVVLRYTHS